jgi:hypothetical protein
LACHVAVPVACPETALPRLPVRLVLPIAAYDVPLSPQARLERPPRASA